MFSPEDLNIAREIIRIVNENPDKFQYVVFWREPSGNRHCASAWDGTEPINFKTMSEGLAAICAALKIPVPEVAGAAEPQQREPYYWEAPKVEVVSSRDVSGG